MIRQIIIRFMLGVTLFMPAKAQYLSPEHIVIDSQQELAYVSLATAGKVISVDLAKEKVVNETTIPFHPAGLALSGDGQMLYIVGNNEEGKVLFFDTQTRKEIASIPVGHTPEDLTLAKKREHLFICNRYTNDISVVSVREQSEIHRIPVLREPVAVTISPDEKLVAVANFLPVNTPGDNPGTSKISLIDAEEFELVDQLALPFGSTALRDLCFSKDGDYLYVSHQLSRTFVPATQLNRGWLNNSALSIFETKTRKYITSVLLDDPDKGAASPYGIEVSMDNNRLFVVLSGTHELCIIDRIGMHEKIKSLSKDELNEIPNTLTFLSEFKTRIPLKKRNPKYLGIHKNKIFVPAYFSTNLLVVHADSPYQTSVIPLGEEPASSPERLGEQHFHDASLAYQGWQSCATCHLGGARIDGLSWDLPGDGFGNPKNTKSLLTSFQTPPVNHTGNVANLRDAVRSGIQGSIFVNLEESFALELESYLSMLKPVPSPYLKKGRLSERAIRGEVVFQNAGCAECHKGVYYTDMKKYDVGTGKNREVGLKFDTPSLFELWRTAPFLHDGRAASLEEMLVLYNPDNKHGSTSGLSQEELNDLLEYLQSL